MRKARTQVSLDGEANGQFGIEVYRKVLLELGAFDGYVLWHSRPAAWVFEELDGMTTREFVAIMQKFVQQGGEIDQVVETRDDYTYWRFHYDVRMPVSGRLLYVETVLDQKAKVDDCEIFIVNVKDR